MLEFLVDGEVQLFRGQGVVLRQYTVDLVDDWFRLF